MSNDCKRSLYAAFSWPQPGQSKCQGPEATSSPSVPDWSSWGPHYSDQDLVLAPGGHQLRPRRCRSLAGLQLPNAWPSHCPGWAPPPARGEPVPGAPLAAPPGARGQWDGPCPDGLRGQRLVWSIATCLSPVPQTSLLTVSSGRPCFPLVDGVGLLCFPPGALSPLPTRFFRWG